MSSLACEKLSGVRGRAVELPICVKVLPFLIQIITGLSLLAPETSHVKVYVVSLSHH